MLLKTKHRAAIYSTGEIWGFESACSVSNHIIAERWRHARTKVTPQVLKSSIAAPPIPSFFYLIIFTSRLQSSSPSVHLRRFAPHHLLFWSPVKWSLRPVLSPDHLPSRRSVSLALFLIVCLVFHSLSLSIYLLFLCSSGCLFSHRLSVLSSCHLPTRFSSFLTLLVFSSPFTVLSLFSLIVSPLSDRFCFRPLHLAVAHPLHLMQLYQIWSPLCHFTFYISIQRWQKLDFLT